MTPLTLALMVLMGDPLAAGATATANPAPQGPLSLRRTLELADARFPAIRAAEERHLAAMHRVDVAVTEYLPRADLLWQTNRATANNAYGLLLPQGVVPAISGPVLAATPRNAWSSAGGLLVAWQPFDFGARAARVDAARQGATSEEHAAALTHLEVMTAAASAYLDLAAARQVVVVGQAALKRMELFAERVQALVTNQLRPGADAAQAEAQVALARTQLIEVQTQEEERRAALAEFLLVPDPAQVEIDPSGLLTAIAGPDPAPASPAAHPAALQEASRLDQEQAQLRVVERSYVPVVTLMGAVSGRGAGTALTGPFPSSPTAGLVPDVFDWAAGIQVSFSAFDLFRNQDQREEHQATLAAEQLQYTQTLADLSQASQQAVAALRGARQAAANTPAEVSAARASEAQQTSRYNSGLGTVVDVAAAESLLAQAEGDDALERLAIWRGLLQVAASSGDLDPFLRQLPPQP